MAKWFEEIFMDSPCWKRASPSSDPTSSEEGKSLSFSSRSSVFPAILISECINEPTSRRKQQTNHQFSCKWPNGGKKVSKPTIKNLNMFKVKNATLNTKIKAFRWTKLYSSAISMVASLCPLVMHAHSKYARHIPYPPFLWRYGWVTENKSSITNLN